MLWREETEKKQNSLDIHGDDDNDVDVCVETKDHQKQKICIKFLTQPTSETISRKSNWVERRNETNTIRWKRNELHI